MECHATGFLLAFVKSPHFFHFEQHFVQSALEIKRLSELYPTWGKGWRYFCCFNLLKKYVVSQNFKQRYFFRFDSTSNFSECFGLFPDVLSKLEGFGLPGPRIQKTSARKT